MKRLVHALTVLLFHLQFFITVFVHLCSWRQSASLQSQAMTGSSAGLWHQLSRRAFQTGNTHKRLSAACHTTSGFSLPLLLTLVMSLSLSPSMSFFVCNFHSVFQSACVLASLSQKILVHFLCVIISVLTRKSKCRCQNMHIKGHCEKTSRCYRYRWEDII